ncbi:MAG: WYL domain-containing protein [Kiritimatiellae bacterium]|nr:WYL domain-containing protein [Kiritimatiellia bacterium]
MTKFKTQYTRLLFIDRKLKAGGYPNCKSLGAEWEVSPKTFQRDIDYLKYQLDAPIEYSHAHRGYYYTEPNFRLPAIPVSESDLLAVYVAEKAIQPFRNTPLYSKLASVFDKIGDAVPDKSGARPAWIDTRIFFFHEAHAEIDPTIWETIATALRESRRLAITHKSPARHAPVEREVDPYHLVNYKGQWYLSSFCHLRRSIRTFALSRISAARILRQEFAMPPEYSREKMFGDQFGIVWQETKHDVRVQFTARVAPYIRERTWHPSQRIREHKDGGIVLSFTTNHIKEVKDWVLRWGDGAKVLAPQILVQEVTAALRAALAAYR